MSLAAGVSLLSVLVGCHRLKISVSGWQRKGNLKKEELSSPSVSVLPSFPDTLPGARLLFLLASGIP